MVGVACSKVVVQALTIKDERFHEWLLPIEESQEPLGTLLEAYVQESNVEG